MPAQNLVYADREGHIGYQSPGRIPIRQAGNDGTMPVEGWVSANDWTGEYIPFDGLPSVLDPEEGFIVTANQAVIDERYPYLLTKDWDYGYRSTRIREVLESEGELSVSEMAGLQLDSTNPMAETLVPYLLDVEALPSPYYRNAQNLLRDWDFSSAGRQPGRGLLQRRVAHDPRQDLPRRAAAAHLARRRRPVVPAWSPRCCRSPPARGGTTCSPTTRWRPATTSCGPR